MGLAGRVSQTDGGQPGRVSDGEVGGGAFDEGAGRGGIEGSRRKVAWLVGIFWKEHWLLCGDGMY